MQSLIQILKVNDIREGTGKTSGQPYRMQDCECLLLNEDGSPAEVGVLMLSKDQVGKVVPGSYMGQFALRANKGRDGGRRIEAVLTGLQAVEKTARGYVLKGAA